MADAAQKALLASIKRCDSISARGTLEHEVDKLTSTIRSFRTADIYTDLVVTCRDDTYNVHKLIVCGRADFFARAMRFGGKVSARSY